MKKDKEWLKSWFFDGKLAYYGEYINYKIDEMDEPDADQAYKDGYDTGIMHASKPDKLLIPKFVADWWERDGDSVTLYGGLRVEKKHKFGLISKFHDRGLGDYLSRAEDWIDENDSAFLDLVNGKPYEVEKEKLYYIKFSEDQYAQRFDESKIDSILVNDKLIAGRFTEEQIKKMNPKLMAFAVEVAE